MVVLDRVATVMLMKMFGLLTHNCTCISQSLSIIFAAHKVLVSDGTLLSPRLLDVDATYLLPGPPSLHIDEFARSTLEALWANIVRHCRSNFGEQENKNHTVSPGHKR